VALALPGDPALVGTSFFAQAGYADPAAPQGLSLSAGLRVTIE
jgi:hypothetical protein